MLTIGCQPKGTCYQCCCVLTSEMYFAECVVAADTAVAKALALMGPVPADEGVQLLIAALPKLLFLTLSVAA
jgi:hypothetical protein